MEEQSKLRKIYLSGDGWVGVTMDGQVVTKDTQPRLLHVPQAPGQGE